MKYIIVFLILYLTCFDTNLVESGIILDRVKTGISDTRNTIQCGVKKLGGLFTQQQADCEPKKEDEKTNEVVPEKNGENVTEEPKITSSTTTSTKKANEETSEHSENASSTESEKASSTTTVTEEKSEHSSSPTESTVVPVSEGRRLIGVGGNCPEGQRADVKGNCREEY